MFTVTTMTMRTARLVTPAVTTAAASIAAIDMERTLTQLPFWSSLTEQEQETLRRSAFVRHYEKGAFVHSSDNECLGMLFVLSGEIRTYLLSEEGREVTLFRLYPGELCVLSASCVISQITFDTQMTAGMDTEVLIIPANIIAALKEKNLYVRCFLYELATKRFSDVMWAMQQIMFKGLDRRLAEFLLAEAARTGSDTIRMTHEQLAQHISSAREAVARMLKSFSEDGLVGLLLQVNQSNDLVFVQRQQDRLGILTPAGAEGINLWHAADPTAPWRSWHGRVPPLVFGIYRL
jgi:CRP/FNR family transcriptional regulator, anaerobic regulatory protein